MKSSSEATLLEDSNLQLSTEQLTESASDAATTRGYNFRFPSYMYENVFYDKKAIPIHFKATPDTLLNRAASFLDTQALPEVYKWNNEAVISWLRRLGYAEYEQTFRVNYINGRNLSLLDEFTLPLINIRNALHIRHLSNAIRELFPDQKLLSRQPIEYALYRHYRSRTGNIYENIRISDFCRINVRKSLNEWDLLEKHLNYLPTEEQHVTLIGGVKRPKTSYSSTIMKPRNSAASSTYLNAIYDSITDEDL